MNEGLKKLVIGGAAGAGGYYLGKKMGESSSASTLKRFRWMPSIILAYAVAHFAIEGPRGCFDYLKQSNTNETKVKIEALNKGINIYGGKDIGDTSKDMSEDYVNVVQSYLVKMASYTAKIDSSQHVPKYSNTSSDEQKTYRRYANHEGRIRTLETKVEDIYQTNSRNYVSPYTQQNLKQRYVNRTPIVKNKGKRELVARHQNTRRQKGFYEW